MAVDSKSVDTDGVQRIELWVDDQLLRIDSNPDVNSPYIVSQTWQSDVPGEHVILVKAFDAQGTEGQSQPVAITLATEEQTISESTPVAEASPTLDRERITSTPGVAAPTLTPSPTPTLTPARQAPTNTPVLSATPKPPVTPPTFEPTGLEVHDIFKPIWEQPEVKDYVGYPTEAAIDDRRYARQYFERGYLYWWDRPSNRGLMWAIEIPQPDAKQGSDWVGPYEDSWDGGDPFSCDAARANPDGPVRGFGKLWCDHPEIAQAVGTARGSEQGTGNTTSYGVVQNFQGGVMLYSPLDREVWALINGGAWQRYSR
jgi:hypothetical protein